MKPPPVGLVKFCGYAATWMSGVLFGAGRLVWEINQKQGEGIFLLALFMSAWIPVFILMERLVRCNLKEHNEQDR